MCVDRPSASHSRDSLYILTQPTRESRGTNIVSRGLGIERVNTQSQRKTDVSNVFQDGLKVSGQCAWLSNTRQICTLRSRCAILYDDDIGDKRSDKETNGFLCSGEYK